MTQHSSLKGGEAGAKFRSVLKRHERIKELGEKEKWDDKKDSIYHLPKIKRIKFKVKKVKAAAEEGEGAEGVAAGGAAPAGAATGAETKVKAAPGAKDKASPAAHGKGAKEEKKGKG